MQKNTFTLKTTIDAITIRNHILQTFENIISADEAEKESLLNLVIVGAGPTGVELTGAFTEIENHILPKDYPNIDFSKFNIVLIEGSKNTLNSMSNNSKNESRNYLSKMGVNILTETFVKNYDGNILTLSNGEIIKTKTVIWAAGVTGNSIRSLPENEFVAGNRIIVNRINQVAGEEALFAMGTLHLWKHPNTLRGIHNWPMWPSTKQKI